jgi:serpin B
MMRRLALLAALAVLVAACGSTGESTTTGTPTTSSPEAVQTTVPFQNGELARLDVPRDVPSVSDADIAAVTKADAAFGLDLLRATAGDDNLMLSPYSIATALSMLYPGAKGATAQEIAAVLHLDVPDETLHAVRNAIETALSAEPTSAGPDDERQPFVVHPANSAWGQGGYPFLDDYLRVLASQYGAGLRLVDFINDPQGATDTINAWVEDATENRIKDLIPDGDIDPTTRLVLVNAIWFYANWAEQFDPDLTSNDPFTLANGEKVTVPMMHQSLEAEYGSNAVFEAVRVPYAGDASMIIALPKSRSLADTIAATRAEDLDINWSEAQVDLSVPSFQFDSDVSLKDALEQLGMIQAFDPATADLTGITAARELFVSDALHKTFIAVDETGTEAAAATALIMRLSAARVGEPITFTADRPFLFWIEQNSTGEMLFLGQVTDPR